MVKHAKNYLLWAISYFRGNHPVLINLMISDKGLDQHNICMFKYLLSVLGGEEGGGRSLLTYMFTLSTETNENGLQEEL